MSEEDLDSKETKSISGPTRPDPSASIVSWLVTGSPEGHDMTSIVLERKFLSQEIGMHLNIEDQYYLNIVLLS